MSEPKKASLVLVMNHDHSRVLLGRKKTGEMGRGLYNGPGGKIEPQDRGCLKDCAIRETFEEWGLILDRHLLLRRAILNTCVHGQLCMVVHVFTTDYYVGNLAETEDSRKPEWHPIDQLPLGEMHAADQEWMTRVLKGEKLRVNMFSTCLGATPYAMDFRPLTH
jgi:8-oxo-dGTP diphosphatase